MQPQNIWPATRQYNYIDMFMGLEEQTFSNSNEEAELW